jgi:hypothetical protein
MLLESTSKRSGCLTAPGELLEDEDEDDTDDDPRDMVKVYWLIKRWARRMLLTSLWPNCVIDWASSFINDPCNSVSSSLEGSERTQFASDPVQRRYQSILIFFSSPGPCTSATRNEGRRIRLTHARNRAGDAPLQLLLACHAGRRMLYERECMCKCVCAWCAGRILGNDVQDKMQKDEKLPNVGGCYRRHALTQKHICKQ